MANAMLDIEPCCLAPDIQLPHGPREPFQTAFSSGNVLARRDRNGTDMDTRLVVAHINRCHRERHDKTTREIFRITSHDTRAMGLTSRVYQAA